MTEPLTPLTPDLLDEMLRHLFARIGSLRTTGDWPTRRRQVLGIITEERAALASQPTHTLLMPPHPDGVYQSSALCSCSDWQYDAASPGALAAAYRDVLRSHTEHASQPAPAGVRDPSLVAALVAAYHEEPPWMDAGTSAEGFALLADRLAARGVGVPDPEPR